MIGLRPLAGDGLPAGRADLPPADSRSSSTRRPGSRPSGSSGQWSSARSSPSPSRWRWRPSATTSGATCWSPICWSLAAAATAGRGLRYDVANRGDWWAIAPVALVALALWVFPPPSEYVIGGKDPGVYMNAGVQIAQRGSLVIDDRLVASLPAETRGLFFPQHRGRPYYSNRFMGFFLINPDTGSVIDQFPHLYPTAVAIGYDMAGLTGARYTSTVCAVMGVAGPLLSRREADWHGPPAPPPRALLAIHLVQVWHARIPNSEILAQGLLLAGLLALARAHHDDDVFFAPVAGVLLGLLPFARFDGVLAVLLAGVGLAAHWMAGGRVLWAFLVPLIGGADGVWRLPADVAGAVCRAAADLGRQPTGSRWRRWPWPARSRCVAGLRLRQEDAFTAASQTMAAARADGHRRGAGGVRVVPARARRETGAARCPFAADVQLVRASGCDCRRAGRTGHHRAARVLAGSGVLRWSPAARRSSSSTASASCPSTSG